MGMSIEQAREAMSIDDAKKWEDAPAAQAAPAANAGPIQTSAPPPAEPGAQVARTSAAKFRTLLTRTTTEDERQTLVRQLYDAARAGDAAALTIMADRILPKAKPVSPPVEFDMSLESPAQTAVSILAAVGEGKLSTDQGKDLVAALTGTIELAQMQSMGQELENLRSVLAELIEDKR